MLNLIVNGCTTVPDKPVCVELGPDRAFCTYTIQDKDFYWDDTNKYENKTYWEAKPSMVLVPPSSWVAIKTFIIEECKKNLDCSGNVDKWERGFERIEEKLNIP